MRLKVSTQEPIEQAIARGWPTKRIMRELQVPYQAVYETRRYLDTINDIKDLTAPKRRGRAECGSPAGYHRHRRNKEPICEPCRVKHNEELRGYYRKKRDREAA